jgi:hypothetical protein
MKLALAIFLLAAGVAHADDSFETKAAGAQRIHRLENVVWALTAPCDQGDDTEQRQCRIVRDKRAAELANATLLVEADKDAFDIAAWNAAKKSTTMSVTACIRCAGVDLDGKTWLITGGTAAPKIEGGKIRPTSLAETQKGFADQAAAQAFAKHNAEARVQMVVKLGAKSKWAEGGKQGLALEILAFRVVAPCDGAVLMANVPSGPAEVDKKGCAGAPQTKPAAGGDKLPESMSMSAIKDAMKPVVLASDQCFGQFNVAGNAKLKFTVNADGTVAKYEQQGDFVNTPTGDCIDKAVKNVSFPRVKKLQTSFSYPINLK